MRETTSLLNPRKKGPEQINASSVSASQIVIRSAAAVGVLFAACLVLTAPSTTLQFPFTSMSTSTVDFVSVLPEDTETFELSLEQKLELWEQWKGLLNWQETWSHLQEIWKHTQDEAKSTLDEAKTNITSLLDPDKIHNHTRIFVNQTLQEGQDWWDQAQDYYNNLTAVANILRMEYHWNGKYPRILPPPQELPHLVYLNHAKAFELLWTDDLAFFYSKDYFLLNQGLDAQINQAYCGVATAVAVLNSLRGRGIDLPHDGVYSPYAYATQSDVFNDCTDANVVLHNDTYDGIFHPPYGLNLLSVQKLLQCHLPADQQWNVQAVHVDESTVSVAQLRSALKTALLDPNARVLVNFHRGVAGQEGGGGHFSPIGGYDPPTDAFLIVDVAKYKYAPVWIATETLHASLAATDICGIWTGPQAQIALPPELLQVRSMEELAQVLPLLGCQAAPRGYIIVSKL